VANGPDFQPVRSGTGNDSPILNLAEGTTVNGSSVFSTFVQAEGGENPGGPGYGGSQMLTGLGGNFTAGQEGYLGFKLNGADYGWMRVVFTNNTGGTLIKDWAYNTGGGTIATGNVLQYGSTVTLDSTFGSFTLGSQITGTNQLVKTGSGTATVTGDNDYSGTTTVNTGTLALAAGASLSGSGAANIEGLHSPGGSPGLQTFEAGLGYTTGSSVQWELTGNSLGLRGTDFDGINVTGGPCRSPMGSPPPWCSMAADRRWIGPMPSGTSAAVGWSIKMPTPRRWNPSRSSTPSPSPRTRWVPHSRGHGERSRGASRATMCTSFTPPCPNPAPQCSSHWACSRCCDGANAEKPPPPAGPLAILLHRLVADCRRLTNGPSTPTRSHKPSRTSF
jgi:autotransporter-associated beta strand protein